jgi:hypothetical protein
MSATLRFELRTPGDGDSIPLDAFAVLTEHLSGLLIELDRDRSGGRSVRWVITGLEVGSAIVEVTGKPERNQVADMAPLIVSDAFRGLDAVRVGRRPRTFSVSAWDHARAMVTTLRENDTRVALIANGAAIELGPDIALEEELTYPTVEASTEEAISTIEGSIETVYLHDRPHFEGWDVIYGRRISCDFERDLLENVREGLGERVRVHGRIAFDRDGRPERMREVIQLQVLRDADRPRPADLRGLVPNMTGGLGAAKWIRRIRDADA